MPSNKTSLIFPLSIISGVVLGAFFREENLVSPFSLYVLLLFLVVVFVWFFQEKRIRVVAILLLFFLVGFWRGSVGIDDEASSLRRLNSNGVIVTKPSIRGKAQMFEIRIDRITPGVVVTPGVDEGQALSVITAPYPRYSYGDWLSINCPKVEEDTCAFPSIHVLGTGKGSWALSTLFWIKGRLSEGLARILPEPHASFASALLLGERSSMPEELKDAFQRTGTTHIVAVSGMHIVILGEMIKIVLGFFAISARSRRIATAFFLLFFTAMIGAPASAVRGLFFGLILLLAESSGRPRQMSVALSVTCSALLLWRPSFLFDPGFQLSFLAVIGIVYGVPVVMHAVGKWMPEHPLAHGACTMAIVTFSATLATAPLLAAVFGRASLVGLIANVLIVPIVEPATILTLATAILALFSTLIAFPFGIVLFAFLDAILLLARALAKIPGASLDVAPPSPMFLFVIYGAFFTMLFYCWLRMTPWERNFSESTSSKS